MRRSKYHAPDYLFLGLFAFVAIFGVIMLSSASNAIAFQRFGDSLYYVRHQLLNGFLPGLIVCAILSFVDYKVFKKFAFPIFVFSIALLLAVFTPLGASFGGARSWIDLGIFTFQPSEIVKLAFIIYLAAWLERRDTKVLKDFSDGLVPFLISLGIIMFLILLQPDVGTMSIIVMIALMVYFIAGASIKHLLGLGLAGIAMLGILIKIAPYRAARFTVFLHPELDPQGIGYHINQALLAIGSGGLFGLGFGYSRQKHLYLPEVIGDSIFAIIAEELGFVVVVIVLLTMLALIFRGYHIARQAPDQFGKLMAAGIMSWIGFQSFVNISAMVGLLPITGLPLPFVSYGSSSLVVLFAAIGIVVNISRQMTVTKSRRERGRRVVRRPDRKKEVAQ